MRMVEKMRRKVLCMLLAFVVAVSSANVNIMAAESRGSMGFGIGDSPVGEQSELSGTQREVTEEGTGDSGISDKALDGETEAPAQKTLIRRIRLRARERKALIRRIRLQTGKQKILTRRI